MQAVYFEGPCGEHVRRDAIPEDLRDAAERARRALLDTLSLYDDDLMEMLLEERQPERAYLESVIRRLTIARDIVPVLMGSAYRNKGVQPLMDAVVRYLPSPLDRMYYAKNTANEGAEVMTADPDAAVAMAFLVDEAYRLTFARVPGRCSGQTPVRGRQNAASRWAEAPTNARTSTRRARDIVCCSAWMCDWRYVLQRGTVTAGRTSTR